MLIVGDVATAAGVDVPYVLEVRECVAFEAHVFAVVSELESPGVPGLEVSASSLPLQCIVEDTHVGGEYLKQPLIPGVRLDDVEVLERRAASCDNERVRVC